MSYVQVQPGGKSNAKGAQYVNPAWNEWDPTHNCAPCSVRQRVVPWPDWRRTNLRRAMPSIARRTGCRNASLRSPGRVGRADQERPGGALRHDIGFESLSVAGSGGVGI